jgi:hypothetical protein
MLDSTSFAPEGLDFLPGYVRADVAGQPQHFIRWLLEAFEANLHLVERITENSWMLFDPEQVPLIAGKVSQPTFLPEDLVDVPSFARKVYAHKAGTPEKHEPHEKDEVSLFLWKSFSEGTKQAISEYVENDGDPLPLRKTLANELNQIILGDLIDRDNRFAKVRFSSRTRSLRSQEPQKTRMGDSASPVLSLIKRQHRFNPAGTKLEVNAKLNRLLLQDAYPGEIRELPQTPLLGNFKWESDWLQWLASFISLDIDQEWFSELDKGVGTNRKNIHWRTIRAAAAIKNAARLYPWRGTPFGLTGLLEDVYGWQVEIVERSWPGGMKIGHNSTIGVDTFLMGEFDPDVQFTVLIEPTENNLRRLDVETGPNCKLEIIAEKPAQKKRLVTAMIPVYPMKQKMASALAKIHNVIDSEKPVHASYFLALAISEEKPAEARPQPPVSQPQT